MAKSQGSLTSGDRWELRSGYHNLDIVERAAEQGKWLVQQVCSAIGTQSTFFAPLSKSWFEKRTTVHLGESRHNAGKKNLDAYPGIVEGIPDLLELIRRSRIETGDTEGCVNLITQAKCGRGRWHKDDDLKYTANDSLISELQGWAVAAIKDPNYGLVHVTLCPGDALFIDNSGLPKDRLPHMVKNAGSVARLALVD